MAYWYVDKDAVGTNAGTSWTNAWHGFDHVVWGVGGVTAGDTLYISGGSTSKTYTATAAYMMSIEASGTLGNSITIATGAKSPSPTGHNGTVIFEGADAWWGLVYASSKNYITLDGEKSGTRNWTFQNATTAADAAPVTLSGGTGNKVTYITITKAGMGIWLTWANAYEVSYCSITNIQNDCAVRAIAGNSGATEYGLSKFHHNIVQTNWGGANGPDGIQCSTSTDIYNNTFYTANGTNVGGQHPDMVQSAGPYVRVYNNEFRNPLDSAFDADGDSWGRTNLHHLKIYNNLFITDSNSPFWGTYSWPSGIRIYDFDNTTITELIICNNTFADLTGDGTGGGRPLTIVSITPDTLVNVYIQNNLFYNTAGTGGWSVVQTENEAAPAADWHFDYNLVNAGDHGATTVYIDGSAYIQDHPKTGIPAFVSYTHNVPSNDFHLAASDTAAKNQGSDMSAWFTTDKDGVARPQGTGWDIGAYEYTLGIAPSKFFMMNFG